MAKTIKIEERTEDFILALQKLEASNKMPSNAELIRFLGINSISSISEIKGKRQNIQREAWLRFKEHFPSVISEIENERQRKLIMLSPEVLQNENFREKYYRQLEESNVALQKHLDIISKQADAILISTEVVNKHATIIDSQQETIHFLTIKKVDADGRIATSM